MKKGFLYVSALLLAACGGNQDQPAVEVNTGEQSSVVETTTPQNGTSEDEHFEGDGHDHGVPGETTSIEYMEETHDFGSVFYPSDNLYTFKFKNTGTVPLVIEDAHASCGCTVPNKPEEPIMPGQIGELDVIFRPKESQIGQTVTKKITVTANTNPAETYLEISAKVVEAM